MQNSGQTSETWGSEEPGSSRLWLALSLFSMLGATLFFHMVPHLDIAVSRWFFEPQPCPVGTGRQVCGTFPIGADPVWMAVRTLFHVAPIAMAAALLVWLVVQRGAPSIRNWGRLAGAALATLAIGPGLLVNGLLKEHWGRPRPSDTDLFGGTLPFVPAGEWSTHCQSNCSFVSGEASTMFWTLCLVPLLPARYRMIAAVLLLCFASLAAGMRVAFGRHYFSDVFLAGLLTLTIYWLVRAVLDLRARTTPGGASARLR